MSIVMSKFFKIKARIFECMKSGDNETRDILKTLVGELQAKAIKENMAEVSDNLVERTVKSFKENAAACLAVREDEKVEREIAIYEDLLPKYESVEQIVLMLSNHAEALSNAKATGPATGMAMGILKKAGYNVQGQDVANAVKTIRGEP
jgi:uncharacterized protein YqeY